MLGNAHPGVVVDRGGGGGSGVGSAEGVKVLEVLALVALALGSRCDGGGRAGDAGVAGLGLGYNRKV